MVIFILSIILVNVYMISRPSLSSISKLVSRVKGIKIYSDEEA